MKLSFIIPALNEEKNIRRVVSQFRAVKGLCDFEVIVADGRSKDKTRNIARNCGAKVYVQPPTAPRTIGCGRNLGAKHAKGDIFIFCDADTKIDNLKYFVHKIEDEFKNASLLGGNPKMKVFKHERNWKDVLYAAFYGTLIKISYLLRSPISFGQCQIVRKAAFQQIGGYDNNRVHAEDTDMMKRLAKAGKVKYFSKLTILESARRYRKIGHLRLIATGVYSFVMFSILKRNVLSEWKRVN